MVCEFLFTIGMSLRTLSEQAATTKKVLLAEYEKVRQKEEKEKEIKQHIAPRRKQAYESQQEPLLEEESPEEEIVEDIPVSEELENARAEAVEYLAYQCNALAEFFETTKEGYDEAHAIPFFTSYSEGEQPLPFSVSQDLLAGINTEPLAGLLNAEGVEDVLPADLLNSLRQLLEKFPKRKHMHQDFSKRCSAEISPDHNVSVFYDTEATELKKIFNGFPILSTPLGLALEDCQNKSNSIIAMLGIDREGAIEEPSEPRMSLTDHNPF